MDLSDSVKKSIYKNEYLSKLKILEIEDMEKMSFEDLKCNFILYNYRIKKHKIILQKLKLDLEDLYLETQYIKDYNTI
jgi:hypothetical protein